MKAREIREKPIEELRQLQQDAAQALFNLRFQFRSERLQNTASLTRAKRELARIKTIVRQKEMAREKEVHG
jgi:large subunit ribosomal protein L29